MTQKPFDLLLIEGAYEYQLLNDERLSEEKKKTIRDGLIELGDLCRIHSIPVRVIHNEGWGAPQEDPNITRSEHIYKDFFDRCYYKVGGFGLNDIHQVTNDHPAKIILTGGVVEYKHFESSDFELACEIEEVNPDIVETMELKGGDRTVSFLWGCVPARGARLFNETECMENRPNIFIDPVSSVNIGENLDLSSVYKVEGPQYGAYKLMQSGSGFYVITTKTPRSEIINRNNFSMLP